MKIYSTEIVQEFSNMFKRVYDSIPPQVKPPEGAAQLHYAYAFHVDFALFLREKKYVSLTNMMNDVIELEVNLMASGKINKKLNLRKLRKNL